MTPGERTALESQSDRHLRRGELSEAWALLQKLAHEFPGDASLAERLAMLEESMDPAERRRVAVARVESSGTFKSPMHEAESLAAAGRYAEAITVYRKLLTERPDWDLVKERLAELFQLAQVASPTRQPGANREVVLGRLLDRITARKRT